ncbi:MAG: PAS domain S-box protein [Pyrinomonadaceae bacterium]
MLQTIAVAANQSTTVEEALQISLDSVCAHTGWPIGDAYLLDESTQELVPTKLWHLNDTADFKIFRCVTDNTRFVSGVGLPGRILASGKPAWIMDVTKDPNFPRAKHAQDIGVRAGFGFPLMVSAEVVGILEFFSPEAIEPDEDLLETMAHVGTQLGRVVERKRAEQALRESEMKFRSVTQSASDGIIAADGKGQIISWNNGAQRIFGYEEAEALGSPLTLIMPEVYRSAHKPEIERHAATGETHVIGKTVELYGLRKAGEEFPLELSLATWKSGEERFYSGIIRDITELKQIVNALRENEEKHRELIENANDIIYTLDLSGQFTSLNRAGQQLTGYTLAEALQMNIFDVIGQDDVERVRQRMAKNLAGTPQPDFELEIFAKDGGRIRLDISSRLIRQNDVVVGIQGIARDITERKRAEEVIRLREIQLTEAQQIAHLGSWEWDVLKDEVRWSDELYRIFGVQPQVFGATYEAYLSYIHLDDLGMVESAVENALHDKVFPRFDNRIIRPDGTVRVLQASGRVIVDEGGRVVKIVGTAQDITQHKRMENDLEQARDAALEASRLKSEFLANMSHEIRTPLNGVMGMLGLLLDSKLNKTERELAEMARASAESLLSIVNDVLDFSKIEAGKLEIAQVPFDLRALVEEVIGIVSTWAEQKNLDLIVRYSPTAPRQVVSDPGRIRQCLLNLLSNAIKFTEQGYVYLDVEAKEQSTDHMAFKFTITDTGIGIPSDQLDHSFERFTQVDGSITRRYGGTGLGLAITKRLVEIMSGTAGVASAPKKGSTFWFNLPLLLDEDARQPVGPAGLAEVRIMIVSGNEINRRVLHEQIISWRLRNGSCESGEEALKRLRTEYAAGDPYQIVLIDYQLPEMDGLSLGKLIKADAALKAAKLVLLTSVRHQEDIATAKHVGFAAYLTKPVRQSQLMDTLVSIWSNESASSAEIVTNRAWRNEHNAVQLKKSSARVLVVDDNAINQKVAQLALQRLGCQVDRRRRKRGSRDDGQASL